MARVVVRLAVAAFLAATAGLGVPGPAQAATCGSAQGVTVVVDFHELGGGVQTDCDLAGAGHSADVQLEDAGHTLTYVQRQPGFVCRVDGAPSTDPCVNTPPADAYWSLWWSDGKSGKWSYASTGVTSLVVPAGGYVALSWQGDGGKATPRITPVAHATAPPSPTHSPTSHPTSSPTSSSSSAPSTPTGSTSSTPSTSAPTSSSSSTTSPAHARHQHVPPSKPTRHTHHPAATQADAAPNREAADAGSGSGLPGWVAPGVVGLLFVAAGAVAVVRRKRAGGA